MTKPQRNYPIQEQELLALVLALRKWRHYIFGTEITAYTYHASLATWETNRDLSGRKAHWTELDKHLIRLIFPKVHDALTAAHLGIDRAFAEL